MRRKVILDGNFVAYEDGTVFKLEEGVEKPVELKECRGYFWFSFKRALFVHRIIAEAFIPNTENKPCVNHIDCNKHNNSVSNLEWCTYQENSQHAVRMGLLRNRGQGKRGHGRVSGKAKCGNFAGARLNAKYTQKQVAEALGVTQSEVSNWESGRVYPKVNRLSAIAELYGCTVNYLLGGDA